MGFFSCSRNLSTVFRDNRYHKRVWLGKRTIKQGECCALWDISGKHHTIEGPTLKFVFFSEVRFLKRFVADQHQYLVVQHVDASVEHIQGPKAMFLDPVKHVNITVKDAVNLKNFEALVVYTQQAVGQPSLPQPHPGAEASKPGSARGARVGDHVVQRTVLHGPCVFYPTFDQYLHSFAAGAGAEASPKLSLLDQHLHASAPSCKSADDVPIEVKVGVSFKVVDVEKLLDWTEDPRVDLSTAARTDTAHLASKHGYTELLKVLGRPAEAAMFPSVHAAAARMGVAVSGLTFEGYTGSRAIGEALARQLEASVAAEAQETAVANKLKLSSIQDQMAWQDQEHEKKLRAVQQEGELALAATKLAEELKNEQERHAQRCQHARESNEVQLQYLAGLKDIGVDLTKYLTTPAAAAPRPATEETLDGSVTLRRRPPGIAPQSPRGDRTL